MRKLTTILLALVFVFAMFAGCRASENTDTDIPVGNMDVQSEDEDAPSDITEAENSTVAENATDKTTENTTSESASHPTTAKETTTKKAETTAKPTTTKKAETTTKKESTTKKKETTTQKSTTTKPAETTAKHTHNWTAHYAERKVLVKEAWDEPIYETRWHDHIVPSTCIVCGKVFGIKCKDCGYVYGYSAAESSTGNGHCTDYDWHCENTGHEWVSRTKSNEYNIPYEVFVGYEHHDAEYKTEKYIDYYTCSCGETKKP